MINIAVCATCKHWKPCGCFCVCDNKASVNYCDLAEEDGTCGGWEEAKESEDEDK